MSVERVIGNTIGGSNALAANPITGDLAYTAGCFVVLYNPRRNKQTQFLSCRNNRKLSSVAFSSDGALLAAGECGRQPSVLIWDLKSGKLSSELRGHAWSVRAVQFSPDCKYLATAGSRGDGKLKLWQWSTGVMFASARISCTIRRLSFAEDGQVLVSAGSGGHLRHWMVSPPAVSGAAYAMKARGVKFQDAPEHSGDFVGFAFRQGARESFAVTSDGLLLSFDRRRCVDRWVDLKAAGVSCLSASERYLVCGCNSGVVRVFSPLSLEHICTLPRPPPVRPALREAVQVGGGGQWADVIAVALTTENQRLACVYADRSVLVWDIRDTSKVCRCRALPAHNGGVYGLASLPPSSTVGPDCFLTCSVDSTIRMWSIPGGSVNQPDNSTASTPRPDSLKELQDLVRIEPSSSAAHSLDPQGGVAGAGCLSVTADGSLLACGDRHGDLRVYRIGASGLEIAQELSAHDSEVLSVDWGGPDGRALASGGRDGMVHVMRWKTAKAADRQTPAPSGNQGQADKAGEGLEVWKSLEDHGGAVSCVRFTGKGRRLITCGGDKRLLVRSVGSTAEGKGLAVGEQAQAGVGDGVMSDIAVDRSGKVAVTVGQDKGMTLWDVETASKKRRYDSAAEHCVRVASDPTGMYLIAAGSDRGVRLHDFFSGEAVWGVWGHAEAVTGVAVTSDLERLVTTGADGLIMVWRLPVPLARTMKSRRAELNQNVANDGVAVKPLVALPASKNTKNAQRPTVGDLLNVSGPKPNAEQKQKSAEGAESQPQDGVAPKKSMLAALLDRNLRPTNSPRPKNASEEHKEQKTASAGSGGWGPFGWGGAKSGAKESPSEEEGEAVNAGDMKVEDFDGGEPEKVSGDDDGMEIAGKAEELEGGDETFTVLRSVGVLLPAAGAEGDEDAGDEAGDDSSTVAEGDGDEEEEGKVKGEQYEKRAVTDPIQSTRLSVTVSHKLKEQIRAALHDEREGSDPIDGQIQPKEDDKAPVSGGASKDAAGDGDRKIGTAANTPRSTGGGWLASPAVKNELLARDIEQMRSKLQKMGMCKGKGGEAQPRREGLVGYPNSEGGLDAPAPTPTNATERDEQSLFARMRQAGTVRAAERADRQVPTPAANVYQAMAEPDAITLADERRKMKEEARRKAEEDIEKSRQAEEEARREKFRGAKEEADKIRERLKLLEARKAADKAIHPGRETNVVTEVEQAKDAEMAVPPPDMVPLSNAVASVQGVEPKEAASSSAPGVAGGRAGSNDERSRVEDSKVERSLQSNAQDKLESSLAEQKGASSQPGKEARAMGKSWKPPLGVENGEEPSVSGRAGIKLLPSREGGQETPHGKLPQEDEKTGQEPKVEGQHPDATERANQPTSQGRSEEPSGSENQPKQTGAAAEEAHAKIVTELPGRGGGNEPLVGPVGVIAGEGVVDTEGHAYSDESFEEEEEAKAGAVIGGADELRMQKNGDAVNVARDQGQSQSHVQVTENLQKSAPEAALEPMDTVDSKKALAGKGKPAPLESGGSLVEPKQIYPKQGSVRPVEPTQGGAGPIDPKRDGVASIDPKQVDPKQGASAIDPKQGGASAIDPKQDSVRRADPKQVGASAIDQKQVGPRQGGASPLEPQQSGELGAAVEKLGGEAEAGARAEESAAKGVRHSRPPMHGGMGGDGTRPRGPRTARTAMGNLRGAIREVVTMLKEAHATGDIGSRDLLLEGLRETSATTAATVEQYGGGGGGQQGLTALDGGTEKEAGSTEQPSLPSHPLPASSASVPRLSLLLRPSSSSPLQSARSTSSLFMAAPHSASGSEQVVGQLELDEVLEKYSEELLRVFSAKLELAKGVEKA